MKALYEAAAQRPGNGYAWPVRGNSYSTDAAYCFSDTAWMGIGGFQFFEHGTNLEPVLDRRKHGRRW